MRRIVVLTAAMVVFAGCVGGEDGDGDDAGPDGDARGRPDGPAVRIDAAAVVAGLRAFTSSFPHRFHNTPDHEGARDAITTRLGQSGLDVVTQPFDNGALGLPAGAETGLNIVGIRWGDDRLHWVVVATHYDSVETAVEGAYDNGSGTVLTLALADAFAGTSPARTIAFAFFDQEDQGFAGSRRFVEAVLGGTFEHDAVVEAAIDLDMVGITHPHPAPLGVWENDAALRAWVEEFRLAAGVPDERIEYRVPNQGTTHAAAFVDAGLPSVSFWSNMDQGVLADGTRLPGAYPFWHQADTYDNMVVMAGDVETLVAGFQTVLDIVAPLVERAASAPPTAP